MTDRHSNYIAGDWVAGAGEIENRNPSDVSDLIGLYAQADADQLDGAIEAARTAPVRHRRPRPRRSPASVRSDRPAASLWPPCPMPGSRMPGWFPALGAGP